MNKAGGDKKRVAVVIRKPRTIEEMQQYYDVRYRVLREPLGMARGSEYARPPINEIAAVHIMAMLINEPKVIGAVMGFIGKDYAKVHALCIDFPYQRQGISKALMLALEDEFRKRGASKVYLNSREHTVPYYEKLGYHVVKVMSKEESKRITGMDIIFIRMEKSLLAPKL